MTDRLMEAQSAVNGLNYRSEVFDIAITGIGVVSPLGIGCSANVERLLAGDSAVIADIPPGIDTPHPIAAAHCPDFDLTSLLKFPKAQKYMSRPVQLAMRAAIEAFESSGLVRGQVDPYRLAIYTAAGQTGLDYTEFSRALEHAWGPGRERDFGYVGGTSSRLIDPYFSLRTLGNGGMALLSTEFGAKGPSSNFVHSETAFALALQAACLDITEGRSDAAIVGGFDCLIYPTALFALSEAGILTADAADIGKLAPAEGAAFFVVERQSDATARGAAILADILGVECSLEPVIRNTVRPASESSGRGIRRLLRRLPEPCQPFHFAVSPGDVPHWTITRHSADVPVANSLTRATGYLGAATAAVELALGLASVRHGFVPSVMAIQESNDGGVAIFDEACSEIDTLDPTGIFFSRSWSGQMAAIAARARSTEQRKVFGACAP